MDETKNNQAPRKEASPESIASLRNSFEKSIALMGQTLENLMPVYKTCCRLLKEPQHADNQGLLKLKIVYEVAITFYLAEMDNAAIFHADFTRRSNTLYRQTFLLQCYRVISEVTKALFGFGKDQRHALWPKLVSTIDLSSFLTELEEIAAGVEKLKSEVIDRDARNYASHYDWDALATADFFKSLDDEDIICQDWNQYLFVAKRISFILSRLFSRLASTGKTDIQVHYPASVGGSTTISDTDIKWGIEKQLLKPELVDAIQSSYENTEKQLAQSISICRKYKAVCDIADSFAPNLKDTVSLERYQKIANAVGILSFMTNDAHAAAIALTESSSYWESRMHLKRLDVAIYEGLDKIVGFTEESKKSSLFHLIDETVNDLPTMIQEQYALLKEETESLIQKYDADQTERRCSFVHYRTKKKIWVEQTYDNLLSINVPDSLLKVIELRNLTTKIVRFVTLLTGALSELEERRSLQSRLAKFQQLRDLVGNIKDETARGSALRTIESIQNKIEEMLGKARRKR